MWMSVGLRMHLVAVFLLGTVQYGDAVKVFVVAPRMTNMVKNLAESCMKMVKAQDLMFLKAGVDTMDVTSTRGMKTVFTATKHEAKEIGDERRAHNMLLDELSNLFRVEKIRMARALHSFVNRTQVKVRGLGSNDDLCDDFNNIRCNRSARYRTTDGSCNNFRKPSWGRAFIPMRRFQEPQYDDGISVPRIRSRDGGPLPSSREVSLTVHATDEDVAKEGGIVHMLMQWGQFLDHDITSTPVQSGVDGSSVGCCMEDISETSRSQIDMSPEDRDICFPIRLPQNDPKFRPKRCMNFVRSVQVSNTECSSAPVEQMNQITAYIDASGVYGSSDEDFEDLRQLSGGFLRASRNNLLPEDDQLTCLKAKRTDFCFRAGDGRVNEQMALAALHTVWMREHNRMAEELGQLNPSWDDEKLFQETRKIVGAKIQHITYTEFLPVVLSDDFRKRFDLVPVSSGHQDLYDDAVDASIRNSFASAAYRFGHSLIRTMFSQFGDGYQKEPELQLKWSFGNTSLLIDGNGDGVNKYLRGLVTDAAGSPDGFMSPELTQHLFEDAGGHSLDLAALNIQRGRDHGLPSYNQWRKWCNLPEARTFKSESGGFVDHQDDAIRRMQSVYRHPDDVDLFAGGVSEIRTRGGLVGPTFACILAHQFKALKVGDRFWYERDDPVSGFSRDQLDTIKETTLAKVLCDNTEIKDIQPSAFQMVRNGNTRIRCLDVTQPSLNAWSDNPKVRDRRPRDFNDERNSNNEKDVTENLNNGEIKSNNGNRDINAGNDGGSELWSEWSACVGTWRFRARICPPGSVCPRKVFKKGKCNNLITWSPWNSWSSCSGSTQSRHRSCRVGNRNCPGRHSQVRLCRRTPIHVQDGNFAFTSNKGNGRNNGFDNGNGDDGTDGVNTGRKSDNPNGDVNIRFGGTNGDDTNSRFKNTNGHDRFDDRNVEGTTDFNGDNRNNQRFGFDGKGRDNINDGFNDGQDINTRFDRNIGDDRHDGFNFNDRNDRNNGIGDRNRDDRSNGFNINNRDDRNNGFDNLNIDRNDGFHNDNRGGRNNRFNDNNRDNRNNGFDNMNSDRNNGFNNDNRDDRNNEFNRNEEKNTGVGSNNGDNQNSRFDAKDSGDVNDGFRGNRQELRNNNDAFPFPSASWGTWGTWGSCERNASVRRRDCVTTGGTGQPNCVGSRSEIRLCARPNVSKCNKKIVWAVKGFICK